MCGRFTLRTPAPLLIEQFGLVSAPNLLARFNIAPTQDVAVVRARPEAAPRELALLRWGLIPSWARDPAIGARLINARAETVATKPSFRAAIRSRRCLVPADGFYEWRKTDGGKQPYHIQIGEGRLMGLAGLWEAWSSHDPPGTTIESCTILTTEAAEPLSHIHHRMPVVIAPDDYGRWLDPGMLDPDRVVPLMTACQHLPFVTHPVGTYVNAPSREGPQCLEPDPSFPQSTDGRCGADWNPGDPDRS